LKKLKNIDVEDLFAMDYRTKALSLLISILIFLLLTAGFGLFQINNIKEELTEIAEEDLPLVQVLTQITAHRLEQAIQLERALRFGLMMEDNDELTQDFEIARDKFWKISWTIDQDIIEGKRLAETAMEGASTQETMTEFKTLEKEIGKIKDEHVEYKALAEQAFILISEGKLEEAAPIVETIEKNEELGYARMSLLMEVEKSTEISALEAEKDRQNALKGMLVITLISVLSGLVLGNTILQIISERQQAYEELKDLDRIKTDVLTNVSHEIRTPITIVQGAIDLADEDLPTNERREVLNKAQNALNRLDHVVGNIINVTKIGSDDLRRENVSIKQIMDDVVGELQYMADENNVSIESKLEDFPEFYGDPDTLRNMFYALINNAIKFNKKGGTVKTSSSSDENGFRIIVKDTGIGIHQDEFEKIFQPLYQIDATTTRKYAGTGMGLALASSLAKAQGGRIIVKSKLGKGSRFTLFLPKDL